MFLIILSSCSINYGSDKGPTSAKKTHYVLLFQDPDWSKKNDPRSDYVFEHKEDGRVLLSNSFCQEFQDQPLDTLAKKTFKDVVDFKVLRNDYVIFHDREAHQLTGSGTLEGAKVSLEHLNTRRNNCYIDFVAISPETAAKDQAFEKFLRSVEFK